MTFEENYSYSCELKQNIIECSLVSHFEYIGVLEAIMISLILLLFFFLAAYH